MNKNCYNTTTELPPPKSHIHLIGIGGSGVSNIAYYLSAQGYRISGSDYQSSQITDWLQDNHARIYFKHSADNITDNTRLVIKSAAVKDDNPEILKARRRGIPILKYAQALGLLMSRKIGIAVSGTHGKTTTSALISYLLSKANLRPSFIVGGVLRDFGAGAHYGKGDYFVAEACEYDRSFHHLPAQIKIVTNIEADHMDYYKTMGNLIGSFHQFIATAPACACPHADRPADGCIIANIENPGIKKCLQRPVKASIITFASKPMRHCQWYPKNIRVTDDHWQFDAYKHHKKYGNFMMGIPGDHNVLNGLVAVIVSDILGINKNVVRQALAGFKGVRRRFEVIGRVKGRMIIDDYAHHPTELETVLSTARRIWPGRRLWISFQPHLYSRTKRFLNDFARVLSQADIVLMPPIYAARDNKPEQQIISSEDVVNKINRYGGSAKYFPDFSQIVKYLKQNTIPGDIIITVGAGDGWQIGTEFVKSL